MPEVRLMPQMQEGAKAEIAAGLYLGMSDVVRAALRRLMEERGAAAFYRLKAEVQARR
jgi:antitoxin ParD1/3/4